MTTEGYPPDERETTAEREDTDALLDRAAETPPGGEMTHRPEITDACHRGIHTPECWIPDDGKWRTKYAEGAPDRPCGRCHDGTGYEWHPVEGWVSVCCGAPPLPEDAAPWMETD